MQNVHPSLFKLGRK